MKDEIIMVSVFWKIIIMGISYMQALKMKLGLLTQKYSLLPRAIVVINT